MNQRDEVRDIRAVLLGAAEAEIVGRGVTNVSLRAIARRAGVSHQAPGHFFGNAAGLFTALATREFQRLRVDVEAAVTASAGLSARQRLSAAGLAYIRFAGERREMFALTLGEDMLNPDDGALVRERELAWSVLNHCVIDAQAEGWRRDQPLEVVATLCWVTVHGTATAWVHGLLPLQFPGRTLEHISRGVLDGL